MIATRLATERDATQIHARIRGVGLDSARPHGSGESVLSLARCKEGDRGKDLDPIMRGTHRRSIGLEHDDPNLTAVGIGQTRQPRRHNPAWRAPANPEINENGYRRFERLWLKRRRALMLAMPSLHDSTEVPREYSTARRHVSTARGTAHRWVGVDGFATSGRWGTPLRECRRPFSPVPT